MTSPTVAATMQQSTDIFDDAFSTFIDEQNVPGFDSLNKSSFFDKVMNASKLFDGEDSLAVLNDSFVTLKQASRLNRARQASRRPDRKTTTATFPELESSFYLNEGIDEEGMVGESDTEREEVPEEFQEEILCAFLLEKIKRKTAEQEQKDIQKIADTNQMALALASIENEDTTGTGQGKHSKPKGDDGESVTTATASISSRSSDGSAVEEATKRALALASVVSSAGQVIRQTIESKTKRTSQAQPGLPSGEDQDDKASAGDAKPKRRSGSKSRKKAEDDVKEESVPERRNQRKSERSGAIGSKHRRRRAGSVEARRVSSVSSSMEDKSEVAMDASSNRRSMEISSRNDNNSRRRERRSMAKPVAEASTPRRKQRLRAERSRSFGCEAAKEAATASPTPPTIVAPTTPRRPQRLRERARSGGDKATKASEGSNVPPLPPTLLSPSTPRRARRMRERSRSFGPVATGTDAPVDAAVPPSPMTPRRNRTLPTERPGSVELRRVTRDPRRNRRASLGQDVLRRNLQLMAQTDLSEARDDDMVEMPSASPAGNGSSAEKQDVWKQRRQKSFGDAHTAQERSAARKGSIQAAAFALTTPKAAARKDTVNMDVAMQNPLQTEDDSSSPLSPTGNAAASKDDSYMPGSRRHAGSSAGTNRRLRRRGSCV